MIFAKDKSIQGHAGAIYACTVIDELIYTGSTDKHVARWLVNEGTQDKFAIKFESSIYSMETIENRYLIVGLSTGSLHIFDLDKGIEIKHYTQHVKAIFSITSNKFTNHLLVGDADGNLSVWDAKTFDLLTYIPLDAGKLRDIAISNDGKQFAIACQDESIRIFESENFNEIRTILAHTNGANSVCYHPLNDTQLISGGKDALLKLWDLEKESLLMEIPAHNYAIYSILSVDDGKTIITSSRDKTVKTWTSDLEFIQRLDLKEGGHKHSVNKVRKISESCFVSVSDDSNIIIWKETDISD